MDFHPHPSDLDGTGQSLIVKKSNELKYPRKLLVEEYINLRGNIDF